MTSDAQTLCEDCPDVAACSDSGLCDRERRASLIAIPSIGDPVADRKAALEWARHDERLGRGECPNGCGPLVTDPLDGRQRDCPGCGFHHGSFTISAGGFS